MARLSPFGKILNCITEYRYNTSLMRFEVVDSFESIAV